MKRILYAMAVCCLFACSRISDKELEQALRFAGKNRTELEAVLNHYKNDSLKLKAACYLIRNMPYHYSKEEYYRSPDGQKYRPDIVSFKNKEEVKRHCDSLMQCGYRIEQQKVFDITALDSAYLINNIELAFSVWRKPWAKNISFDNFCRYILPYRAQTEKASSLRKEIAERFIPLLDSARVTSPVEACTFLNEHLKKVIRYQDTGLPLYPTIDETYRAGISQCDGICNLGTFVMRAVGVPVAVDFTIWPKMDLGHSWCSVLNGTKFHSFGPGEDQPDVHASLFSKIRRRRPAKVYRFRFDPVRYSKEPWDDGYDIFLKSPLLYDVTNEYPNKTTCINVPTKNKGSVQNKKSEQVYLCVHNFYEWKPLALGICSEMGNCIFNNVVGDNIFIVADCPDGKTLRYITAPFYVDRKGEIRQLIPQMQHRQTCVLEKRKNWEKVNHTLFYWDVTENRFVPLLYEKSTDTTQTYDQIPKNALLWLTIPERIFNQRVFFIENDSIKIY